MKMRDDSILRPVGTQGHGDMWLIHSRTVFWLWRTFGYTFTLNMSEQVSYESSLHTKATQQLNQARNLPALSDRLTSSSWWRWRRHWRGRNRLVAATSAWGRCRCPPQTRSAPLSSPSTWRKRPAGKAGGREEREHDEREEAANLTE